MKHTLLSIILVLMLSCTNTVEVKFENLTLEEAFVKAKQENKLVMVDFFSKTCVPCWNLLKTVFQDKKYSKYINEHFISIKITPEYANNQEIKNKYNVWGLPTVIFFDNNGKEIDRNCGYDGNKEKYFQTIKDYVENKNTIQLLLQNYAIDSLNVDNNYQIAMKCINRWEIEKSEKYFVNVLMLDPGNKHGYQEEANLFIACIKTRYRQDNTQLIEFINSSNNKDFLKLGYDCLLNFYEQNMDTVKYVHSCEMAIQRLPEMDIAYWRLLNLYRQTKNTNMYLSVCNLAVTNLPNDPDYLNDYAWAIYENRLTDKYNEAIAMVKKAVKLEPDAANIWDTLGWLYYETGEKQNAIKAMQRAVTLNPENEYYKKNLEKFKSK